MQELPVVHSAYWVTVREKRKYIYWIIFKVTLIVTHFVLRYVLVSHMHTHTHNQGLTLLVTHTYTGSKTLCQSHHTHVHTHSLIRSVLVKLCRYSTILQKTEICDRALSGIGQPHLGTVGFFWGSSCFTQTQVSKQTAPFPLWTDHSYSTVRCWSV